MNYSKIVKAMPALVELKKMRLPYDIARDVYKMYKMLEVEYQFFAQEESKLVREYAEKDENGNPKVSANGTITFPNIKTKIEYSERLAELGATDSKAEVSFISISGPDIGGQLITPETIGALEGFVIFE